MLRQVRQVRQERHVRQDQPGKRIKDSLIQVKTGETI
jgi:hypothetical protein